MHVVALLLQKALCAQCRVSPRGKVGAGDGDPQSAAQGRVMIMSPGTQSRTAMCPWCECQSPVKLILPLVSFAPERQEGLTWGFNTFYLPPMSPSACFLLVLPLMCSEPQRLSHQQLSR